MMYEQILIKELPEWLRHLIRKQLAKRMSRPEVEKLMAGNLSEVDNILGKKKPYESLIPLERAKAIIRSFVWNEFKSNVDFSDLKRIDIAYAEDNDFNAYQLICNLEDHIMTIEKNGEVVSTHFYDSIENLIETELKCLNYDEFDAYCDKYLDYGKE